MPPTARRNTGGGGAKGFAPLTTPCSTSEFAAMTDATRAHLHAMHDQAHTVAVELRRNLRRATGRKLLAGVDKAIAARRVSRHLAKTAGLLDEAARAMVASHRTYQQLFLGQAAGNNAGFNIDK